MCCCSWISVSNIHPKNQSTTNFSISSSWLERKAAHLPCSCLFCVHAAAVGWYLLQPVINHCLMNQLSAGAVIVKSKSEKTNETRICSRSYDVTLACISRDSLANVGDDVISEPDQTQLPLTGVRDVTLCQLVSMAPTSCAGLTHLWPCGTLHRQMNFSTSCVSNTYTLREHTPRFSDRCEVLSLAVPGQSCSIMKVPLQRRQDARRDVRITVSLGPDLQTISFGRASLKPGFIQICYCIISPSSEEATL